VSFEAQAAIKGGSDVARLQGTGENASGCGVHTLEGSIADRGHGNSSLCPSALPARYVLKQLNNKAEIISILILR
jgi:hypothetical protein